jgi:cytochrome c oxidase assembly protein subunit 15
LASRRPQGCYKLVVVPASTDSRALLQRIRDARVSERHFRWLSLLTLISLVALIGSGGWVRLSESGLGCPTWPKCYSNQLAAHDTYHALVEFANRCVITTVGVLVVLTLVAALRRRNPRRDLSWLAAGLVVGYVGEAVLGGITVLLKLAPELVAAHLILAMLLLVDGVVLHWRAGDGSPAGEGSAAGEGRPAAEPASSAPAPVAGIDVRRLGQLLLAAITAVIVLGTVATGSGPRAGSPDTKRFPFKFSSTVELHAVVGMFLFGLVVASFFALRATGASERLRKLHLGVVGLMALQGIIGYIQYFTKLQIDLVEVHIIGAALLLIALVRFNLELGPPRTPSYDRAEERTPSTIALPTRSAARASTAS